MTDGLKTFFIVDDHSMIRHGIIDWFTENSDWHCSGDAGSKEEAIDAFSKMSATNTIPGILITDLNMRGVNNGIELIGMIKKEYPGVKIIAYSMYENPGIVQQAISSGADGYLSKTNGGAELLRCLEQVYAGKSYIENGLLPSLFSYNSVIASLTKREHQIFDLIMEGKSNQEIADSLSLKRHAVENYVTYIYEKTDCPDRKTLRKKYASE